MWLAAHAATGAAIQRGIRWYIWAPVALLSHPVLDRVLQDYPEQPWEYAANALLLALLAAFARRYWQGALLAGLPDLEPPLYRLGIIPSQPLHDLWWRTPWHDSYIGTVSIQSALVALVVASMIAGNARWPRRCRSKKR